MRGGVKTNTRRKKIVIAQGEAASVYMWLQIRDIRVALNFV